MIAPRMRGRLGAFQVCASGYAVTVLGFVFAYILVNPITAELYRAAPWSLEPGTAASTALFFGPRLLAVALLVAGIVLTDITITRRLAETPRTNRRATAVWVAFATVLAWVPLAFASVLTVGAGFFPVYLIDYPLASVVVLVPLGIIVVIGGLIGYYAPIGVAVEGRGIRASLVGGWPRLRAHPVLAVRALATLVLGWVLGGVILLVGLLLVLVAIATAWVGVGFLILPVGLLVCLLAVVALTGGHVGYRRATLRA